MYCKVWQLYIWPTTKNEGIGLKTRNVLQYKICKHKRAHNAHKHKYLKHGLKKRAFVVERCAVRKDIKLWISVQQRLTLEGKSKRDTIYTDLRLQPANVRINCLNILTDMVLMKHSFAIIGKGVMGLVRVSRPLLGPKWNLSKNQISSSAWGNIMETLREVLGCDSNKCTIQILELK